MKKLQKTIVILTALSILFSSCSKLIHSHQEFMETLKTKNDVTSHFGIPDQYQELGDTTRWLYDLTDQKKLSPGNPDPVSLGSNNKESKKMNALLYPSKFLYIAFKKDSVIKSVSREVNFSLRKPQPWKTVILGTGISVMGMAVMTFLAMLSLGDGVHP